MTDKILVSLGEGQSLQDLARDLLALADHPHDVETAPRQGGFLVPENVAGRYAVAADEEGKRAPKLTRADASADTDTSAKKPRSRRGRSNTSAAADTKTPAKPAAKRTRGSTASSAKKGTAKASPAAKNTEAKDAKGKGDGQVSDA